MDITTMGQRIRSARKMRGMNVDALAEKIGIAAESLVHIECGAKKTSLQTLLNIAEALDVSLDYLAGRTLSPTESLLKTFADEDVEDIMRIQDVLVQMESAALSTDFTKAVEAIYWEQVKAGRFDETENEYEAGKTRLMALLPEDTLASLLEL